LDVTRLSNEDLDRLWGIEQLNWGVLNESVVRSLLALRNEVEQPQKEVVEQRQKHWKLEGERNRHEGTIAKQASEIERFKNETKKCEDQVKAMKAKGGPLLEEVGELTNL
jgi:septal ring factor EnvC (AmiA/AmiB activator)